MNEGNNFGFTVNTDFEDISSTSKEKPKYEDIISDSSKVSTSSSGSVNFNAFADDYSDDDIYYRKKKRGAAKFFNDSYYKIKKWWKCMSRLKKGLLITTTAKQSTKQQICVNSGCLSARRSSSR